MSSSAKEEIFARIEAALAKSQLAPAPEPPREYRVKGDNPPGSEPVVAEMVEKLEDYKAEVHVCSAAELNEQIKQCVQGYRSVVVPHGLDASWQEAARGAGAQVRVDNPSTGAVLTHQELDGVEAVLTATRCAVSLSGTIMLDGEPDQGRRAITLVPDAHICVLRARDIYEVVPEAVAVLAKHPTRPTTWIAGPSATSDIELKRVDGVHGPRTLKVIIVRD